MKKILITGKDSYIGESVEKWLMREPGKYKVFTIDMKDSSWKAIDFAQFDSVFHVAGIAHIKESTVDPCLYYKVNRDLAYQTAQKAKEDGVEQFIFLSSMSVYGIETGVINMQTQVNPNSFYGKSKIEAEEIINMLKDNSFSVATVRPPMVYGKGCRGNYPRLAKLAKKTPIFPMVCNKRSMIYIDNLSQFIKNLIDNRSGGLFFPQNAEYVNTSNMVKLIAEVHGKKMMMTKMLNPLIKLLNVSPVNKVFGDLVYDMSMSDHLTNYSIIDFKDSIVKTEE